MSLDQDRRTSGGQRVPFEALVVVASQKGGAGAYECEAVDVSETGMHLRTAYLPEIGQTLSFRFDSGSSEIVTEGVVVWRDEQSKGGEFGVRFARLDDPALASLRELCGIPEQGATVKPERATRGSKVKLHIDGLASPMRARVRDDHTGEILVGSNLDFLKVGKTLEFEDVERGKKRPATVDRVEVEVDPASHIPQLVVTLRYENGQQGSAVVRSASADKGPETQATRAARPASEAKAERLSQASTPQVSQAGAAEASEAGASDETKTGASMADVGARVSVWGENAKTAVLTWVAKVKAYRAQHGEAGPEEHVEPEIKPRRVTSPPVEGGLQASGRTVTRGARENPVEQEELSGIEETDEESSKRKKQRILIAAGAGLLALLLVVFAVKGKSPPPGAEASAAGIGVEALPAAMATAQARPAISGDVVTANVPLFGTTPLSTTEAPPLPAPGAAGAQPPGAIPAAGAVAHQGDDGEGGEGDEAKAGATQYGKGTVKKPRTIRIKMDAPITDLKGSTSGNSLTVLLPGRRNVEPAATLAKRDKRLSSVKAVPKDGGIEVSLTFKDGIPPFLAKANGKMLEIDLGENAKDDGDDGETTASVKKHKKTKHAAAQKADAKEKHGKKHGKKHKKSDD